MGEREMGQWGGLSEDLQVAEWLGLRGGFCDRQKVLCWNSWRRSTEREVGGSGSRCKYQNRE